MKAIAPGKIILSGEHAVVYGKPALVMAVNRFAEATITGNSEARVNFQLVDFDSSSSITLQALRELRLRLKRNYDMFLNGELGIRDVLKKPFHLFEFLFITFLDSLQLKLDRGIDIQLHSNIPLGSGMGSSAATILSVLRALAGYYSLDFHPDKYFDFGLEAEKLQHGRPSGVDPYIALHGGFVRFQNKQAQPLQVPDLPFYIVNTGVPESTTGECVAHVAQQFESSKIWQDFEAVTDEIQKALVKSDLAEARRWVKENNVLLTTIGVVPPYIQEFIHDLERNGAAAKVAGAGSIRGKSAGMVTVFAEAPPQSVIDNYGFDLMPTTGEPIGARIV